MIIRGNEPAKSLSRRRRPAAAAAAASALARRWRCSPADSILPRTRGSYNPRPTPASSSAGNTEDLGSLSLASPVYNVHAMASLFFIPCLTPPLARRPSTSRARRRGVGGRISFSPSVFLPLLFYLAHGLPLSLLHSYFFSRFVSLLLSLFFVFRSLYISSSFQNVIE